MEKAILEATHRDELRKNKVKKLRSAGLIPGVIYGNGKDNVSIAVNSIAFEKALRTEFLKNTVLKLQVSKDGKTTDEYAVTYQIQRDVITNFITHIDFLRVDKETKIKLNIPLNFVGVAPGTKKGGVLIKKMEYITIMAKPQNIPASITIDLSSLQTNQFIAVSDIDVNEFTVLSNADSPIVRVAAPRVEVEEEPAAEGEEGEEGAEGEEASSGEGEDAKKEGEEPAAKEESAEQS